MAVNQEGHKSSCERHVTAKGQGNPAGSAEPWPLKMSSAEWPGKWDLVNESKLRILRWGKCPG